MIAPRLNPLTPKGFFIAISLVFLAGLLSGILGGAWTEKVRSCHEHGQTCENWVDVE